ncbi:MAG TPA: hypothetical protein VK494_05740, partial [Gemmatimonadaceae bacterium]|nr:hypothetical protein [Gemmatimonadaceae bacterium]
HWVGSNTTVTFGALPRGTHFVRLDGLLANCLVDGTNPRAVDVAADKAAAPVSFSVVCVENGEPSDSDW